MATATATTEVIELRPGQWVREVASFEGFDDRNQDKIVHRYDGGMQFQDGWAAARAYCGVHITLPRILSTARPLILSIDVTDAPPPRPCRKCLRAAS